MGKIKTARVITIGDEIITGKIVDTNSLHISRFLLKRGYRVDSIVSIGDIPSAIRSAVRKALAESDIVIVTGGLGPTHDDITKKILCEVFKCKTRFSPSVYRYIESYFKKRGVAVPDVCRDYAEIPVVAEAVKNPPGAAPALFFKKRLLALPGVPHEVSEILEKYGDRVIPRAGFTAERTVHTAGVGEAGLMRRMTFLDSARELADIAFLPKRGGVDLRIIARGETAPGAAAKRRKAEKFLKEGIEELVWGYDDDTIESVVGGLLAKAGKTVAVAESCTGGGIGSAITDVSGSSDYFPGGVIAYSNRAKRTELGVSPYLLRKHGAVSRKVASAMAEGVRKRFNSDYGLSATGIAGPTGGTKEKPVGLIYIALAGLDGVLSRELRLTRSRSNNRERTVFQALHLLYTVLKEER